MCQISAKSEHAFVFYGEFCEVCEMKKMKKKKKKKKKTKKLKRNFVRSYLGNGWSDFLQIWYVDYPSWAARLQQIWFQSDKGSQSYIGVKIAFSFFLLIYSRCGAPASWAARHTIVCLDQQISVKIATKFNLRTLNFQNFLGEGGHSPHTPLKTHTLHFVECALHTVDRVTSTCVPPP